VLYYQYAVNVGSQPLKPVGDARRAGNLATDIGPFVRFCLLSGVWIDTASAPANIELMFRRPMCCIADSCLSLAESELRVR